MRASIDYTVQRRVRTRRWPIAAPPASSMEAIEACDLTLEAIRVTSCRRESNGVPHVDGYTFRERWVLVAGNEEVTQWRAQMGEGWSLPCRRVNAFPAPNARSAHPRTTLNSGAAAALALRRLAALVTGNFPSPCPWPLRPPHGLRFSRSEGLERVRASPI